MAVLFVLLLGACSTTSRLTETRNLPPCPIVLAIDDFADVGAAPATAEVLYMTADGRRLGELLVQSLGNVRAASRIVRVSELDDPSDADIVLRPRLNRPVVRFSYDGWSSSWWAAGGLWLVTWIGGMAVDDATYRTDMEVDCGIVFPNSENRTSRLAAATAFDLAFLERNDFFSWPTLQSLILPPFLTSDQADTTREALTQRAVEEVAIELALYLKREFEQDALQQDNCLIRFDAPVNGADVTGETLNVIGTITPIDEVTAVRVTVNGGSPIEAEVTPWPGDITYRHRCRFKCEVSGLTRGSNLIHVMVGATDVHTRTLMVTRR